MSKCSVKQIEKLREAEASEETLDFVEQYFDIKDMEKKGMLLTPEELDVIQQVDEIADSAQLGNRWGTALVSMKKDIIDDINYNEPRYRGQRVTVLEGRYNSIGKADVLIRFRGKYFWVNKSSLEMKVSWDEVLGSEPDSSIDGNFEVMVEAGKINTVEEMNKTFDRIADMDKQSISKEEKDYLKKTMNTLLSAGLRVIPEMNLYVDTQASVNDGFISRDADSKGVYLKINKDVPTSRSEKSATEAFVHELWHAATTFAFNYDRGAVAKYIDRLIALRAEALKVLTVDDLMPDVVVNEEIEREIAEKRLEYISGNLEEFFAYAGTNAKVRAAVKDIKIYERKRPKKWSDLMLYYVKKALDLATMKWRGEKKTDTGEDLVLRTLEAMAKAQAKVNEKVKQGYFNKFTETVENIEFKWSEKQKEKIDEFVEGVKNGVNMKRGNAFQKSKYWAKIMIAAAMDPKAQGVYAELLRALRFKPEGFVWSVISSIKTADDLGNVAQELGLQAVQIDETREAIAGKIADMVSKLFNDKLSSDQKAVLQSGIQMIGGEVLFDEDFKKYYESDSEIDSRIKELESNLDKEHKKFYDYQIEGLVRYMVDGIGNEVQLRNAEAIVRKLGTEYANVSEDISEVEVQALDKIVTLQAIKRLPKTTRKMIVDMNGEGLKTFVEMQNAIGIQHRKDMKFAERVNSKKGHVRETYDRYTHTKVAPIADKTKLASMGYKLVEEFKTASHDLSQAKLGLYVSKDQSILPFNRHAVRFTGEKQMGLSMFEVAIKVDPGNASKVAIESIKTGKKITQAFNKAIYDGKEFETENLVTPEFHEFGRISNYRYNVTMKNKLEVLGLELDGGEALGRTQAHAYDVEESEKLNEIVFEELMVDVAKNKGTGRISRYKEYIELELDSKNEMVRDIAKIMPKSFKEKLKRLKTTEVIDGMVSEKVAKDMVGSRWDDLNLVEQAKLRARLAEGKLWVRRDMLIPMFGMRDLSIVNFPGMNRLPTIIKTYIRKLENIWKDFISVYKVGVIIKTPVVLIGNIVSNFVMNLLAGGNPFDTVKDSMLAWEELTIYTDRRKELIEAETNYLKNKDEKYKREISRIKNDIESMAIYPLIKYGLYTQILEEIETNTTSGNRFERFFDKKLDKMPEVVKGGAQWLYVTDKTKLFQMMQMMTAKSDFVARYAQYKMAMKRNVRLQKQKLGRDLSKDEMNRLEKEVLRESRDTYINYNSPDSPLLQYANDMGFVLFSKYAIRIQRILINLVQGHPIRAGLALMGQEVMGATIGLDPDDAFEKSVFLRGTDVIYSPDTMKMFEQVFTPHLYNMYKSL